MAQGQQRGSEACGNWAQVAQLTATRLNHFFACRIVILGLLSFNIETRLSQTRPTRIPDAILRSRHVIVLNIDWSWNFLLFAQFLLNTHQAAHRPQINKNWELEIWETKLSLKISSMTLDLSQYLMSGSTSLKANLSRPAETAADSETPCVCIRQSYPPKLCRSSAPKARPSILQSKPSILFWSKFWNSLWVLLPDDQPGLCFRLKLEFRLTIGNDLLKLCLLQNP